MQVAHLCPPPKNIVFGSVKEAGSISISPCRACDRRRGGIMIDLPSHNSPRSIINKLLKTYGGTEEWRARRKKLFCSLFVTVAFPRCLFCNTVTHANSSDFILRLLTHFWGGSDSSLKTIIHGLFIAQFLNKSTAHGCPFLSLHAVWIHWARWVYSVHFQLWLFLKIPNYPCCAFHLSPPHHYSIYDKTHYNMPT